VGPSAQMAFIREQEERELVCGYWMSTEPSPLADPCHVLSHLICTRVFCTPKTAALASESHRLETES